MEMTHVKDSYFRRTGKVRFFLWILALKIWILIGIWFLKLKNKLI